MPIESITGKPGNAKTAFLVKRIMTEAAKADRPLWASGIDGLTPGLCNVFKDPREWNAVKDGHTCTCNDTENADPCDAHVIPNGSLIFIDEAWKWFGHLHDASRQATPKWVLQLAEHRHRGLDFVWTYQQPAQIYPFARGLMAEHRHLVRKFGTNFCDAYDWQELCEDVKSQAKRDAAQKSVVAIPKETFDKYKSAEVHTIKRRIPLKLFFIPIAPILAGALLWYGWSKLRPESYGETLGINSATAAPIGEGAPAASIASPGGKPKAPKFASPEAYVAAHVPRIAALPWSAEVYDDHGVTAFPELYCASAAAGLDANGDRQAESCTCLTEQGTRYALPVAECRMIAKQGMPYNPYRKERRESGAARNAQGGGKAPARAALPGSVIAGEQISGYGDIGVGQSESAPR